MPEPHRHRYALLCRHRHALRGMLPRVLIPRWRPGKPRIGMAAYAAGVRQPGHGLFRDGHRLWWRRHHA